MTDPTDPHTPPATGTEAAATDPAGAALDAAMEVFTVGLQALAAGLQGVLRMAASGQRLGTVRQDHVTAAPLAARLIRAKPQLAGVADPDAIEAGVRRLAATRNLAGMLRQIATAVEDTGRVGFDAVWVQARTAIVLAEQIAKRDKAMAVALGPLREALGRGPMALTSTRAVDAAAQNAASLQSRAARAQERVAMAARAHARVTEAQADRHPGTVTAPPGTVPHRGGTGTGTGR